MVLNRDRSAGYLTNWAARLFARELERQLGETGVASAYMPVMFALADGAALTQTELARRAAVEQPTMAATLKRMERDGLIRRDPDPDDRRSALVRLTERGRGLMPTVERVVGVINEVALEPLEPAERDDFLRLLGKVIAGLERRDGDLGR